MVPGLLCHVQYRFNGYSIPGRLSLVLGLRAPVVSSSVMVPPGPVPHVQFATMVVSHEII